MPRRRQRERESEEWRSEIACEVAKDACCCIFLLILIPFLVITLFALSFVTRNPKLYIPALNNSTESNATRLNTSIFLDLRLRNAMPLNSLRYGDLNVTVFYGANRTLLVANYAVPGFYLQGFAKTAAKAAVLRTRGLPWPDAFQKLSGGSPVELATTVKLKRWVYLKRKALLLAADVRLDASGQELQNKAVRLK